MPLCKRVLPREQAQITGQTHLKFPQFNILLAFWLDTELLLIKIAASQFASISNWEAEFLAVFKGSCLSDVGARAFSKYCSHSIRQDKERGCFQTL